MAPDFVTIGVYGFEEVDFFKALVDAGVDVFCDIRQRRGVRGSTYAFANSQRLQAKLNELGIAYIHRKDLAPSRATRELQYAADKESKTAKRQRSTLSAPFVEAYRRDYLAGFDSSEFVSELGSEAKRVALFCVERDPAACHRSLVAERLEMDLGIQVTHIVP
jgi:uncharacterized protein (DUF488 family)